MAESPKAKSHYKEWFKEFPGAGIASSAHILIGDNIKWVQFIQKGSSQAKVGVVRPKFFHTDMLAPLILFNLLPPPPPPRV